MDQLSMLRVIAWRLGARSTLEELNAWEGGLGDYRELLAYAKAAAGDSSALPPEVIAVFQSLETPPP